ncbi:hypothetical protein MVEG_05685 [Podila verticillata NRRL 6337]|nr:hypothetical protein MVEG_05685 [Podila verticillata NRRL 6337]
MPANIVTTTGHVRDFLAVAILLLLTILGLNPGPPAYGVTACGVTIHNEIAHRASRIVLSAIEYQQSYGQQCQHCRHSQNLQTPTEHRHGGKLFLQSPSLSPNTPPSPPQRSFAHSLEEPLSLPRPLQSPRLIKYASLLERKELLFAGSFFPDWGYNCIGKLWNDAAERAHWPPFIEASLRYLHAKYPKPWDDHVQSLIVFLFGTVSHSLGDVSWHALEGLEQGFINVLAETSFDGDYTKGHTLADIGAEFVLSHMSTMNHLMTSWKVPVKDITEIYKTMGYYVPGAVLSHCMRNGFTGAQANARLGSQLFPVYASRSPFLAEQVEDYPMGGLRDMAEWSVECWNGLAEYLDDDRNLPPKSDASIESNSTSFNLCYALWEDRPKNNHTTKRNRHDHMHAVKVDVEEAQVRLRDAGLGVQTSTDGITGMVTFSVVRSDAATAEPEDLGIARNIDTQQINLRLQSQTSSSAVQFSRPSKILRMYNKDNKARAAALGPLQRPNMCSPVDNGDENNGTITLYLPFEYASFGHSVVSGDFDGDGVTDIAVGAPHVTLDPMIPSQGSVFVVQGQSLFSGDPSGTYEGSTPKVQLKEPIDVRLLAFRVLHGDPLQPQSRFGWSMAVVDLNQDGIDDLAIGAPGHGAIDLTYTGSVFVYFGHSGTGLSMTPDVTIYLNKTTATAGTKDEKDTLAGLGYKLRGMDLTGSGYQDLVISMPMASVVAEDGTVRRQAGRVLAFLAQSHHLGYTLDTDRDWELQGDKAFDWFGSAITLATQSSRPGSPMSRHEIPPWSFLSTTLSSSKLLSQDRTRVNDRKVLVVGSPTSGGADQSAMRGKIQGFLIPTAKQSRAVKIFTIHGDSRFQQLGSHLDSFNQQPDRILSGSRRKCQTRKSLLVVGSQSEDVTLRLPKVGVDWQAGVVRILDLDALPDGIETSISDVDTEPDDLPSSPRGVNWPRRSNGGKVLQDLLYGSQPMAHLSAAMQTSSDSQSLWITEPFSSSEKGRILEWEPNFEGLSEGKPFFRDDPDKIRQCFTGADTRTRFGSQLLLADLNSDGMDEIVVTSAHDSRFAIMAGTITIKDTRR